MSQESPKGHYPSNEASRDTAETRDASLPDAYLTVREGRPVAGPFSCAYVNPDVAAAMVKSEPGARVVRFVPAARIEAWKHEAIVRCRMAVGAGEESLEEACARVVRERDEALRLLDGERARLRATERQLAEMVVERDKAHAAARGIAFKALDARASAVGLPLVGILGVHKDDTAVLVGECAPELAIDFAADVIGAAVDAASERPDQAARDAFARKLNELADVVDGVAEEVDEKAAAARAAERDGAARVRVEGVPKGADRGGLAEVLGPFLGGMIAGGVLSHIGKAREAAHKPAAAAVDPNGRPLCTSSVAWDAGGVQCTRSCMLHEGHDAGERPTMHAAADGSLWGLGVTPSGAHPEAPQAHTNGHAHPASAE